MVVHAANVLSIANVLGVAEVLRAANIVIFTAVRLPSVCMGYRLWGGVQ